MNRTMRSRMGALVLMLLLGAGAAQALPEAAAAGPAERWSAGPLTELWSWMASWLESVVAGEEGAGTDGEGSGTSGSDGGVFIDPSGSNGGS